MTHRQMPGSRKYQPLIDYLKTAVGDEFTMPIEDIEALVGPLTRYALRAEFWANSIEYQGRPCWVIQKESGFNTYFQRSPLRVRFVRRKLERL